jgi:hypothetical protein
MEVIEINKKVRKTAPKAETEELIKKLKKEYYRPIKGRFEFVDAQSGWLDFTDRQWPGEPIMQYKISHGEKVELPLGLVKRLNGTKKKVRGYGNNLDHSSGKIPKVVDQVSRINFTSEEFI